MPKFYIAHKAYHWTTLNFNALLLLSGYVCFLLIISCAVVPSDQVMDMFFFWLLMDPCYLLQQSWKIWGTLCWAASEWVLTISKPSKIQTLVLTAFNSRSNMMWRKTWMNMARRHISAVIVQGICAWHTWTIIIQIYTCKSIWRWGMEEELDYCVAFALVAR